MREAWILAGLLDCNVGYPRLGDDVCGIPHVLRLACDLASTAAKRVFVVWTADAPLPDLSSIEADRRLRRFGARLEVVREAPGDDTDEVVIARADRLFHRDMPRLALDAARTASSVQVVGKITGDEHDAVYTRSRRSPASWPTSRSPRRRCRTRGSAHSARSRRRSSRSTR